MKKEKEPVTTEPGTEGSRQREAHGEKPRGGKGFAKYKAWVSGPGRVK